MGYGQRQNIIRFGLSKLFNCFTVNHFNTEMFGGRGGGLVFVFCLFFGDCFLLFLNLLGVFPTNKHKHVHDTL